MKYDLKKSYDQQKAQEYLSKLSESESKVSLTKIHPKRSLSQNSYLHVLFQLWGNEFGYTIDEAKTTIKAALGYSYIKEDSTHDFTPDQYVRHLHKTSSMDSKELTIFIEKFRDWSAQTCDLYLPSPEEYMSEQIYFDNLACRWNYIITYLHFVYKGI